jgi:hypothetical protein
VGAFGWMDWGGGEQPVSGSTVVDIIQADGQKFQGSANAFYWEKDGDSSDITQWRVAPEAKFKPAMCPHCQKPI